MEFTRSSSPGVICEVLKARAWSTSWAEASPSCGPVTHFRPAAVSLCPDSESLSKATPQHGEPEVQRLTTHLLRLQGQGPHWSVAPKACTPPLQTALTAAIFWLCRWPRERGRSIPHARATHSTAKWLRVCMRVSCSQGGELELVCRAVPEPFVTRTQLKPMVTWVPGSRTVQMGHFHHGIKLFRVVPCWGEASSPALRGSDWFWAGNLPSPRAQSSLNSRGHRTFQTPTNDSSGS